MTLFDHRQRCKLVGMVHLLPLPGSPGWKGQMQAILDRAEQDATTLIQGGCDALLVENMGDVPYMRRTVHPETVAAMTLATAHVRSLGVPTGVQVLAGANRQALGAAVASGAAFIRVEGFAYAHVADEGWMDACAGDLLRARAQLQPNDPDPIQIWADVQKKHASHAVTQDLSLSELAQGHVFCGADALVVTGVATGRPVNPNDLKSVHQAGVPVIVGSGVNHDNCADLAKGADALIVGSWLKQSGVWQNPVDPSRVKVLRDAIDSTESL